VQEPEIALKRAAVSALGQICKHNPELAQVIKFKNLDKYSL